MNIDPGLEQHVKTMPEFDFGNGLKGRSWMRSAAGIHQWGDVFEAETVKGNKNYVIFAMEAVDMMGQEWVYYFHGDRGKKVHKSKFISLIDYGDLVAIPREKVDPERMSLSILGLNAMSNGLSFNDYMKVIWGHGHGSQV